jgi:hypothetical protein
MDTSQYEYYHLATDTKQVNHLTTADSSLQEYYPATVRANMGFILHG